MKLFSYITQYYDNRSAIRDTSWRTNVRASKIRAPESLSVSTSWQSLLITTWSVSFQIGWAYVIQAWAIRNLDSTRPAIRTADSSLALSARRPPRAADAIEMLRIDWRQLIFIRRHRRCRRRLESNKHKQTTRKWTSGPIKIDLVLKPA